MKNEKKKQGISKRYGRLKIERTPEKPRDLVDDIKIGFGYKIIRGFNMLRKIGDR